MIVLNVGGGASRDIPAHFAGWDQHVLDIDPEVKPEVLCDAKKMQTLDSKSYDAVFCSHNLEHFHKHEVPSVLNGFSHVLKEQGFAQIVVPDLERLFEAIQGKDIDDVWYMADARVTFHDVLYGWNHVMSKGNLYYAHKCGFTEKSLGKAMRSHFPHVFTARDDVGNIFSYGFKAKPTAAQKKALCL